MGRNQEDSELTIKAKEVIGEASVLDYAPITGKKKSSRIPWIIAGAITAIAGGYLILYEINEGINAAINSAAASCR